MPALSGRSYSSLKGSPTRLARPSEGLIISQVGIGRVVRLVIRVGVGQVVVGGVSGIIVGSGRIVKLACNGAPCDTLGGCGRSRGRSRRRGCVVVVVLAVIVERNGGGTSPRVAAGRSKDPCRLIHVVGLSTGSEMKCRAASVLRMGSGAVGCTGTVTCDCEGPARQLT